MSHGSQCVARVGWTGQSSMDSVATTPLPRCFPPAIASLSMLRFPSAPLLRLSWRSPALPVCLALGLLGLHECRPDASLSLPRAELRGSDGGERQRCRGRGRGWLRRLLARRAFPRCGQLRRGAGPAALRAGWLPAPQLGRRAQGDPLRILRGGRRGYERRRRSGRAGGSSERQPQRLGVGGGLFVFGQGR
jgi:hypothetical protein